uniref:HMG box domain-containing protein n=1 Tax=Caenorhabditis japonica TaxID=281687 RepID=A0A8R1E072_CAEJA
MLHDDFSCYGVQEQFVQWYEIEPTFSWCFNEQKPTVNAVDKKKMRSTSAYALFFREKQLAEKRAAPYATFGQISQRIAQKWDLLNDQEKKTYKQKCEKNRTRSIVNAVEQKARQLLMGIKSRAVNND